MTELAKLVPILQDGLQFLRQMNSFFPATKDFLKTTGLTTVHQLDKVQIKELQVYLIWRLEQIRRA